MVPSTSRPVVLVDQDGPLAGFDTLFWNMCREAQVEMDCEEHEQTAYYATDHVVDPAERKALRQYINQSQTWFADLPPTPGAIEGINLLAEHAEVWICTKPLEANHWCRDGKAAWVRKHLGLEWEKRIIITPDKSLVMGAVLLDDRPLHKWFARATWNPVVYPTTWNQEGSEWEALPHWKWGDPIEDLMQWTEPF